MAKRPRNFRTVRDRETLEVLSSGVEIIRAVKHEPIATEGLSAEQLERATSKVSGSKFAGDWTLEAYVAWLARLIEVLEWHFPPSMNMRARIPLQRVTGIAAGRESHTIEVVARGRYVHAYPAED